MSFSINLGKKVRWPNMAILSAIWLSLVVGVNGQGLPEPGVILYGSVTNNVSGQGLTNGVVTLAFTNGVNSISLSSTIAYINGQFLYVVELPFETVLPGLTANPSTALPWPSNTVVFGRSGQVSGTNAGFQDGGGASLAVNGTDRGRVVRVDLTIGTGVVSILSLTPGNLQFVARTNLTTVIPVSFSVVVTNAASVQWNFQGAPISGATNVTYTLADARRTNSGVYSVVVNGPGGPVATNSTLYVATPQTVRGTQRFSDGRVRFSFSDADGIVASDTGRFLVQATDNILRPEVNIIWTNLSGALTLTNGLLMFEDSTAAAKTRRYYRVIER